MDIKNYNIIKKSIKLGMDRVLIGNGGYIKLLKAPTSAEVLIHLSDPNSDGIPLKAYHSIEAKNIKRVYVSCNAVPGEHIQIAQAVNSEWLKIITPVSDIAVDEIGGYSSSALALLDKVINPHEFLLSTSGGGANTSQTTILSKTLTSDKIKVYLSCNELGSIGVLAYGSEIIVFLDGIQLVGVGSIQGTGYIGDLNAYVEIDNIKGSLLEIKQHSIDANRQNIFFLQEYALKP